MRPRPTITTLALAAGAALLVSCGGGGDDGGDAAGTATHRTAPPGGSAVAPADVAVIRAWADTLRRGDVRGAARRFSLPTAVANGTKPLPLDTRAQVEAFNRSLPCGAVLLGTRAGGQPGLIVATFRLTERGGPGGGECGSGTGRTARTAFVIEDGLITHWLRVQDLPAAPGTPA